MLGSQAIMTPPIYQTQAIVTSLIQIVNIADPSQDDVEKVVLGRNFSHCVTRYIDVEMKEAKRSNRKIGEGITASVYKSNLLN